MSARAAALFLFHLKKTGLLDISTSLNFGVWMNFLGHVPISDSGSVSTAGANQLLAASGREAAPELVESSKSCLAHTRCFCAS